MAETKASDRMNELIRSLQQAMGRLQGGQLTLEELEQATGQAQALYERFVVLRHKAREAAVGTVKKAEGAKPKAEEPKAATEEPSIRLDTRPPDISPQQTSLIDAIAETESLNAMAAETAPAPKPKAEKPVPKQTAPERPVTVADKLEHAPVTDLRKAIALSQKFWFVAELFANDRKRYEEAIDAFNAMQGLNEAEAYLKTEVIAKLATPPGEEVMATFTELLQRRYS
ncbi:MAG TPA: hypothetical protein PKD45_05490 [Flavobacteriales bacterium]|nr:hypothetical protein [Flavobacteriales bacterium]